MKFRCKKFISIILTLLMLMSVVSATFGVLGAETGTVVDSGYCGDFDNEESVEWTLYDDGTLVISGSGSMYNYSIWEGIGAPWHTVTYDSTTESYTATNTTIKKIIVEEGIGSIDSDSFYGLENVESISLPDSLWSSFIIEKCPKLETINIPEAFDWLGIKNCPSLKTVDIDENNPYLFTDESGSVYQNTYDGKTELVACLATANGLSTYTVPEFVDTVCVYDAFSSCDQPIKLIVPNPNLEITDGLDSVSLTEVVCYPFSEAYYFAKYCNIPVSSFENVTVTGMEYIKLPFDRICEINTYPSIGGDEVAVTYSDGKTAYVSQWGVFGTLNCDTSSIGTKTAVASSADHPFTLSYDIEVHDKRYLTEGVKYTSEIDGGTERFYFSPSTTGTYEFDVIFEDGSPTDSFSFHINELDSDGNEYNVVDYYNQDWNDWGPGEYYYPYNYFTASLEAGKNYVLKTEDSLKNRLPVSITFRPLCNHSAAQDIPMSLPTCTTDGHMAGRYCFNCNKAIEGYDVIKAFHWDRDGDGLCDTCSEEITDNLEEGRRINAFLDKGSSIYVEFTPDETGYYELQLNDDCKVEILDENMESLAYIDYDYGSEYGYEYRYEAGKTYYIKLDATYDCFHPLAVVTLRKVNYGGDDDWEDDEPERTYKDGTISLDETLTLDFDTQALVWRLQFTPDETGYYAFSASSGGSDTFGWLFDKDMNEITCNDDGDENFDFKVVSELNAGETYYWGAEYLYIHETGSFDVTLIKVKPCDAGESHAFTSYASDNNASPEGIGTKTAECDYGCGTTHTVKDIDTVSTIIDVYPGETKTFTLRQDCAVIFRSHTPSEFNDIEYWYRITPCRYDYDNDIQLYDFDWQNTYTKEIPDGGHGDDNGEYSDYTFAHRTDTAYDHAFWSEYDEDTELSFTMIAHTHNFVFDRTVAPNCYDDGYDLYRCECGNEKYDNYVPTDGQCNYEIVEVKEPTCADGYTYYECRGCGDGYMDNIVPGSGNHTFSNYTSNNDATCYSDGTKTSYCDVCDTETVVVDEGSKVAHRFSDYQSNGDGTKTGECIFGCGESDTITDVGESYDFEYYISDSKVTITRYTGDNTDVVVVPEEIEGYPVVTMSEDALTRDYEEDFRIDTIFLPKTLTNIEKVAFWGAQIFVDEDNPYYSSDEHGVLFNKDKTTLLKYPIRSSLSEYIIPDTVTKIANSSFVMAVNLTYVEIPDSVKIIGDSAFDMCTECDFSVGKNVEYVGYRAFFMSSIKKAAFGNNLKYMGEYSFNWCDELEEIILPAEFETESYIFEGNSSLRHIGFMGTEEQWNVIARRSAPDPEYLHLNYDPDTAVITEIIEATCQQEGKVTEKCSCGLVYNEYELGREDHKFTNFVYENDGTADMPPSRTAYCDFGCGEKITASFYDVIKNMSSLAVIYACQFDEYDELIGEDFTCFFDGEIIKDNIDELILVALYCNYNFVDSSGKAYWQYPSLDWDIYNRNAIKVPLSYMNELFLNVYGAENVDFSISERYDVENGILFDIGGAGHGPEKAEATYEDGQFVVRRYYGKYTDGDPEKEIIYESESFIAVTFDKEAHITGIYFPDLPEEHTEHTFGEWITDGNTSYRECTVCGYTESKTVTDSGDVELEHPSQPDCDFEVDEIKPAEGDSFLLIEETVIGNLGEDYEVLKAFDITLKNHDGVHVQPDGTVKVKLPLDWEKDGNYKVYRVNDDGTLTDMNAYRQGSHMVFETDHFSIYVIIGEAEKTPEEPDTPDVPDAPGGGEDSKPFDFISELFRWLKDLIELLTSFFKAIA